jgi:hypothetical protein
MIARRTVPLMAVLAALLLVPAAASANAYATISQIFLNTGTVPTCRFTSAELQSALNQAPSYNAEYLAPLTDAVQAALSARANGQCESGKALSSLSRNTRLDEPPTGNLTPPASVTASTGGGTPLPLLVGFILGLCCLIVALVLGGIRWLGLDPGFARGIRHSFDEADYHLADTWDQLRDRFRRRT